MHMIGTHVICHLPIVEYIYIYIWKKLTNALIDCTQFILSESSACI